MRIVALSFLIFSFSAVSSKDNPKYPVAAIPDDLKKNNYGVIREEVTHYKILAKNRWMKYHRKVVTILNPKGSRLAKEAVFYDKGTKVNYVRAAIYDANGMPVRRIKSSEFHDVSAYDDNLFSDNRLKVIDLTYSVYPYTIEFEYEVDMKSLYSLPEFELYDDDEVSIQSSLFTVAYGQNLKPRYKVFNAAEPQIGFDGSLEFMSWTFENVKPPKFEPLAGDSYTHVPTIWVAPVEFENGGYLGMMDTWENFGKWQNELNRDRDILPQATKLKVAQLTNGKTDIEKLAALYEYLQNKTRYVSIQLGIGGLQPFDAKIVDEVGYGDCKALSNYMIALLKEAGVKGYYTKIHAGADFQEMVVDFPTHQTNHVIVAVPVDNDTIWVECTNQTIPLGYLGQWISGRHALMVTENGGRLVRTPAYGPDVNIQSRNAIVTLQDNGDAIGTIRTKYTGLQFDSYDVGSVGYLDYDTQKKWVERHTDIPTFDIKSFSFRNTHTRDPISVVDLNLNLRKLGTITGKRLFLTPNLMNRSTYIPEKLETRRTKIVRKFGYVDVDTIRYTISESLYPEFLPENFSIKSRFGEYSASFRIEQGKLVYIRRIKIVKGEFAPETYNELIDFYKSINKADHTKIVFLNKT